jgi:Abortive infection alpha
MSDESEAFKESAKAAQEIAKTASNAIDAGRSAGGWLDRIFGRAIEDTIGSYWTDRVAARRVEAAIYDWERLSKLLHGVEKRLQKRGIRTIRTIAPKIALPLLEHATMENEEDLHVLWENLLAAALDPSEEEIKRIYVSVLAELSASDAHALKRMYSEWWYWQQPSIPEWRRNKEHRYSSGVGTESDGSAVLFYRLGLILPVHVQVEEYRAQSAVTENTWSRKDPGLYVEGGEKTEVLGDLSVVGFTVFGEKFCNAVIGDVSGLYSPPDPDKS